MQIEVRRTLFKLEKDLPPVDVMFSIPSSNGLVMSLTAQSASATDWNNCSRASYLARPHLEQAEFLCLFN